MFSQFDILSKRTLLKIHLSSNILYGVKYLVKYLFQYVHFIKAVEGLGTQ